MTIRCVFPLMLAATLTPVACAQWSPDPATNLTVADRAGEQVQPKIRVHADGSSSVVWLDNAAGGYDTYVSRLSPTGADQWAHNGVLVINTGYSSTQDYGFDVDGSGRSVVAFRDDTSGGSHIGVQLLDTDGVPVWSPATTRVTTASTANAPQVVATNDGSFVVGWSSGSAFRLQRLGATGVAQWTPGGINLQPATGSYAVSSIVASDAGAVIVLWIRYVGNFLSNKHLYAQKFDASGAALWNGGNPVIVFDANSIQNGYFPTLASDGAGGAVFGWYETGGIRSAYVQRVGANGVEVFGHNGVAVATNTDRLRLQPSFAFDGAEGEVYMFWPETNVGQNQWGIRAQRITASGTRAWGDSAREVLPLSGVQPSFVRCTPAGGGVNGFWFVSSGQAAGIKGIQLDSAGTPVWPGGIIDVCTVASVKGRLDAATGPSGCSYLAWHDNRADSNNIVAQVVNADGSLGPCDTGCPSDIDRDDDVDSDDIVLFFTGWDAGDGDFDGDDDSDSDDVVGFFLAWDQGC